MTTPFCKICSYPTAHLCDVDMNFAVSNHERHPLGKTGEQVSYFKCEDCNFVFTNNFDEWTSDNFSERIYNAEYVVVDPDYTGKRPRNMAQWTISLISAVDKGASILDYGGGSGILSQELRAAGYSNSVSWDPFVDKEPISNGFDIITSFEVFEHHRDPEILFDQLAQSIADNGTILVSTHLVPDDIESQRESWWYIGPRNGHISLYSIRALKVMCSRYGLRCWTDGVSFHVLAKEDQLPSNNNILSHLSKNYPWISGHGTDKQEFYTYLKGRFADKYARTHYARYLETVDRLWNFIPEGAEILEFGDISPVTAYFRGYAKTASYENDLRYPVTLPDASQDVIMLLEVAEHIKDQDARPGDIGAIAMFNWSGLNTLFHESYRILRPGGIMVVTTPNVCSVSSLARIIQSEHPFEHFPHVREHAPRDIQATAERAGFSVDAFSTFFSFMPRPGVDREKIRDAIIALGGNPADRGDTMFFVFRKPT